MQKKFDKQLVFSLWVKVKDFYFYLSLKYKMSLLAWFKPRLQFMKQVWPLTSAGAKSVCCMCIHLHVLVHFLPYQCVLVNGYLSALTASVLWLQGKKKKEKGEKLASSFPVHGTPAIPCHAIPDMCSLALLLPGCRGSPVFVRLLFVFPEG